MFFQQAQQQSLSFSQVTLVKFRGITAKLKDHNSKIYLGHAPFNKRFKKLKKIMQTLNNDLKTVKEIELDYKGKAIINYHQQKT